jgi:DNA polymerase IIIc chi subunit
MHSRISGRVSYLTGALLTTTPRRKETSVQSISTTELEHLPGAAQQIINDTLVPHSSDNQRKNAQNPSIFIAWSLHTTGMALHTTVMALHVR